MLNAKTKGLFVEVSDFAMLAAVASAPEPPFTLERLESFAPGVARETLEPLLSTLGLGKARYVRARCGINPATRFFRRMTLESAAKAKDPAYFPTFMANEMQVDPATHTAAVINAMDGTGFDPQKSLANQKELFLCGAANEDISTSQERLIDRAIYPTSLELSTLSTVGGVLHYARFMDLKQPLLVLEICNERAYAFILGQELLDVSKVVAHGLDQMFPLIQQELGLKDEESARKLFFSNTFDFTEMGPQLLRELLKELQAMTGYYEVQTGQTIGHLVLSALPVNLAWIGEVVARALGIERLKIDYTPWLEARGIKLADTLALDPADGRWLSVLSLMGKLDRPEARHGEN